MRGVSDFTLGNWRISKLAQTVLSPCKKNEKLMLYCTLRRILEIIDANLLVSE